jgi:hypothetical protein
MLASWPNENYKNNKNRTNFIMTRFSLYSTMAVFNDDGIFMIIMCMYSGKQTAT